MHVFAKQTRKKKIQMEKIFTFIQSSIESIFAEGSQNQESSGLANFAQKLL